MRTLSEQIREFALEAVYCAAPVFLAFLILYLVLGSWRVYLVGLLRRP